MAVRVIGELFRGLPVHDRLKGAEFGIAYTRAHVPEGLNSLLGEEVRGFNYLAAGPRRDVARSAYFKDSRCRIARSSASSSEPRKTSSFSSIVARCPAESDVCGSTC